MSYRIGIDVGGTFTDLVLAHDGALTLDKHPTTPRDQSEGVLGGIATARGARRAVARPTSSARTDDDRPRHHHRRQHHDRDVGRRRSASSPATGHRDEIEIRRGYKEDIWDPALPPPPPICPRRRRYGVPERLDVEGSVVVPLDEDAVRRALRRMRKQGVESLAVVLLFSFVNPTHERRVRELAAEELPGVMVSLSHEVMPTAPEFERTSTTLVNAYVGPKIERYLSRLDARLREAGFRGELLIMQSNGGVMPGGYVAQKAVAVMGSGPGGRCRWARSAVAGAAGITDFISVDMGGTSYDVCLVRGGTPEVKAGWNWHHRYLVGLPMVDVQSVGAGGGSIARVESGHAEGRSAERRRRAGPRLLRPRRHRAHRHRRQPRPRLPQSRRASAAARCGSTPRARTPPIRERVARPLGISVVEAADGICRIVNANMANAIRKASAAPRRRSARR